MKLIILVLTLMGSTALYSAKFSYINETTSNYFDGEDKFYSDNYFHVQYDFQNSFKIAAAYNIIGQRNFLEKGQGYNNRQIVGKLFFPTVQASEKITLKHSYIVFIPNKPDPVSQTRINFNISYVDEHFKVLYTFRPLVYQRENSNRSNPTISSISLRHQIEGYLGESSTKLYGKFYTADELNHRNEHLGKRTRAVYVGINHRFNDFLSGLATIVTDPQDVSNKNTKLYTSIFYDFN